MVALPLPPARPGGPFDPDDDAAFQRWSEAKLARYPANIDELIVEVKDPQRLTRSEYTAMRDCLRRANMVIYAGPTLDGRDRCVPLSLARRFGLSRLDRNWLCDFDGLSSLTVAADGERMKYVPYTNRRIHWHTDGYYNDPERQIRALLLHCSRPAARGGDNALLDHELAYLLLRRENPDFIRALMDPLALTIPPGTETGGVARPERPGPVFSVHPGSGRLHMRFTARRHNAHWKDSAPIHAARARLGAILEGEQGYVLRGRLEAGMGLVSNNVLHDRSDFEDSDGQKRLVYRARFHDAIRL
ncbi:MAG TPA: TauD/TfdA family dioxygenase [Gammaproteobacteria bacterium]|nr:TauD/TfdA family dioxygenase [Gammaproteobacteria bacterium]